MITSVAEHTNCTVDPEHTVVLIGVRVNSAKVHVITQLRYKPPQIASIILVSEQINNTKCYL